MQPSHRPRSCRRIQRQCSDSTSECGFPPDDFETYYIPGSHALSDLQGLGLPPTS
jgi:hypothetical protein